MCLFLLDVRGCSPPQHQLLQGSSQTVFAPVQGGDLRQWGPTALDPPGGAAGGAAVLAAALDGAMLALLWSDGTLQCLRLALGPTQRAMLRHQVRASAVQMR